MTEITRHACACAHCVTTHELTMLEADVTLLDWAVRLGIVFC